MDYGMPFLLETPSPEDTASLCAELGLRFVELNASFPPCQPELLSASTLRRLMDENGIYFTLHVHEALDPFCDCKSVREAWLQELTACLDLALSLDMPVVNMHLDKGVYVTLPDQKVFIHSAYEDDYLRCADSLMELAQRMLTGTATRLCIENTNGFQPHETRVLEKLLQLPCIGLTLDIGHSHAMQDVDLPFYREHAGRLLHMHGHDARGKSNHLALGDGEIDLNARFAWARERGARVVLETKTVAALRQSVRWLSSHPSLL